MIQTISGRDIALSGLKAQRERMNVIALNIANAENTKQAKPEALRVRQAVAQTAAVMKRFTPKARGSAGPIIKRNCHIKIILSDE